MCCKNKGECKGSCIFSIIIKVLLIVGGLNWGLVGIGYFLETDLNLVTLLLGSWPILVVIVYLIVGLSAIFSIFNCKCKKCLDGKCCEVKTENKDEIKTDNTNI